ncbi:hypothetical protein K440DRAFT_658830 [Wilcoxina mikolae CBS 423.85]|nr:hypothetical protein K440DRAFT_658830 [Wilcoxina mikolae CBS 423.85]
MAPSLRRKKGVSSSATASPVALIDSPQQSMFSHPPPGESMQAPKSPFRRVNDGRITKTGKQTLLENLELELNERTRKLRSQYTQQSHALKQRIEMRINRIPKKFWKITMADLLAQAEGRDLASSTAIVGGAKGFVNDIRRLSGEGAEKGKDERLTVSKRVTKKSGVSSGREQMPPPPLPPSSHNPLGLSSKSNLPLSSSPARSPPPQRSTPQRTASPIKLPKGTRTRKIVLNTTSSSRPTSRATTRSSTETAGTAVSAGMRGTKSSQAKAKAAAVAAAESEKNKGLKRGGMNNTGSNGSLKENRVAGVKKETASKANGAGRVLRSRK